VFCTFFGHCDQDQAMQEAGLRALLYHLQR
jgi:hypothetical protein